MIDFGCCAVGDPACDLTMAWTSLTDEAREAFRRHMALDQATWARARGWALWKAVVNLARGDNWAKAARHRWAWRWPVATVLDRVLADAW